MLSAFFISLRFEKAENPSKMKKILPLLVVIPLLFSSCRTMDNWLFNASDYHLIERSDDESWENSIYWDDFDYDIWDEELEYD